MPMHHKVLEPLGYHLINMIIPTNLMNWNSVCVYIYIYVCMFVCMYELGPQPLVME